MFFKTLSKKPLMFYNYDVFVLFYLGPFIIVI